MLLHCMLDLLPMKNRLGEPPEVQRTAVTKGQTSTPSLSNPLGKVTGSNPNGLGFAGVVIH